MPLPPIRLAAAMAAFISLSAVPTAQAQAPVRIVCGFPPGGSADFFARLLADELSKETGRTHSLANRPGAGGALAADQMKTTPKAGSTILASPDTVLVLYPHTVKQPRYSSRDFAPVAMAGTYNLAFTVAAEGPYRDFRSFVAAMKAEPAKASYGAPGAGSVPHLFGVSIGKAVGIPWTAVPYKGAAPLMTDVIGGNLPAMITPLVSVMGQVQSGKLKVLATSDSRRSPRAPDAPTFAELGYPQLSVIGWYGVFLPAGTAPDIVAKLNESVNSVLRKPAVAQKLAAVDSDAREMNATAFASLVQTDTERWGQIVKESGFTVDTQ